MDSVMGPSVGDIVSSFLAQAMKRSTKPIKKMCFIGFNFWAYKRTIKWAKIQVGSSDICHEKSFLSR